MRPAKTLVLLLTLIGGAPVLADVPAELTFQGYLASAGGDPITGPVDLEFRIYDQESGGTALWSESHPSLAASNGLFTALLGSATPFPADLFDGSARYLAIAVDGGDEMLPRQRIAAVPYALEAQHAAEAVNATMLDGHQAADFAAADHSHPPEANVGVDFSQNDAATALQTSATEVTVVEISAPTAGWVQVVMQGQFNVQIIFGEHTVTCEASISTDGSMNNDEKVSWSSSNSGDKEIFSRFALIPVDEGDTTFHFVGKASMIGMANCSITKAVITAMFVPNRY